MNTKRLKLMRAAGRTQRWHTMPPLHQQSVGEHTFGALAILCEVCRNPSTALMRALLYHDAPEPCTGDIPSNVKWLHPNIEEVLKTIEGMVSERFGLHDKAMLTEQERRIAKYCDSMELVIFGCEEITMGNRLMALPVKNVLASIERAGLDTVTNEALELFTMIKLYAIDLGVDALAAAQYLHGRVEL